MVEWGDLTRASMGDGLAPYVSSLDLSALDVQASYVPTPWPTLPWTTVPVLVEAMYLPNQIMPHACHQSQDL